MTRPKPPGTDMHGPVRRGKSHERHEATQRHEVRVLPPVSALLQSLEAICGRELARMGERQKKNERISAGDIDKLASALHRVYQTAQKVDADYAGDMEGADDDELEALAAGGTEDGNAD